MSRKNTRRSVMVCNFIIILLCAISIASYFVLPFWKVSASYKMEEKQLEEMFISTFSEGASESDIDMETIIREAIDEDGLTLSASLGFESMDILSFLKPNINAQSAIEKIVDDNVSNLVDELNEPLNKIAKNIVSVISKQTISSTLRDQVQSALDTNHPTDGSSTQTAEEVLEEANITDAYITQKTNVVLDALYAENATVESVTQTIVAVVDEVMVKLSEVDSETFSALSSEDKEAIEMTIASALEYISDDGKISININGILLDLLQKSGFLEQESNATSIKTMSQSTEEQDVQEELKTAVKDMLMEKIPENLIPTVASAMKIVAGVLLFTFFTWAYLVLKIIMKTFLPNNAIRLKLPIWLGWLPFLVLYAIPTYALQALGEQLPAGLTISFYTGAWISFAVAVFLFVFSIFYGILYKKLRTK